MKKRVNERTTMVEKFECDYIYTCETCGKERDREYHYKIQTPDNFKKIEDPEFCSAKCMREWFFTKQAEDVEDGILFNEEDFSKNFSVFGLSLHEWRDLLTPNQFTPQNENMKKN